MISREEIEELIGPVELAGTPESGAHASPGQHARHYSPRTSLVLLAADALTPAGRGVRLSVGRGMPAEPRDYAAALYATLHELDQRALDWIAVDEPPDAPAWAGIRDRLRRAATPRA
jgi:L-threonylcarbamoyladenylate synthase